MAAFRVIGDRVRKFYVSNRRVTAPDRKNLSLAPARPANLPKNLSLSSDPVRS